MIKWEHGIQKLYFAQILGISSSDFKIFQEEKNKVTILKLYNSNNKEIDKIKNKVTELGYTNESISYEEFKHLYNICGTNMKEYKFAQILGIKYANYNNMKNKGTRAVVLKENQIKPTKEEIEIMIQQVSKLGYKQNDSICYEEFLILYRNFSKKLSKPDFARMLGIEYSNYNNMKNKHTKAKIFRNQNNCVIEENKIIQDNCLDILERCHQLRMDKMDSIKYVKIKLNLTNEQILQEFDEYLQNQNLKER